MAHLAPRWLLCLAALAAWGCAKEPPAQGLGKAISSGEFPETLTLSPEEAAAMRAVTPQIPENDPRPPEERLLPMGVWVERPGAAPMFTYLDSEAGPSMAGEMDMGGLSMHMIVRIDQSTPDMVFLSPEEAAARGLPAEPDWLKAYGPQPPRGSLWGEWRLDPRLKGRFTVAGYPDDLQVGIYDGTPEKMVVGSIEIVWVRIVGCEGDVCTGRLLNEPFRLPKLHQGQMLRFRVSEDPGALLFYIPE